MASCIEHKICELSHVEQHRAQKYTEFYMKIDLPRRIDADIDCLNVPIDHSNGKKTLFVKKPIVVGFIIC